MKTQLVISTLLIFLFSCSNPQKNKKNAERFYEDENYEKALVEINKAIELEPDSVSHYVLRMMIYDLMGKYKEEVSDLSKIIDLNKNENSKSLHAHHQRAVAQTQLGLYKEAISDIDYFIENRDTVGSLAGAYVTKASIFYKLSDYNNAQKCYELAVINITEKENKIKSQALVGIANLTESDKEALTLLDEAISIDDKNSIAYCNRAAINIDIEQINEAYSDLRKAISLNPNDATINFNMGQLYAKYTDNLDSAIICFNNAIRSSPQPQNKDMIYMYLAVMKRRSGKPESALVDFRRAEELNPQNDLLLYNFSMLLSDLGRNSDALVKISRAIDINSTDSDYFNLKGSILLSQSRFTEAEKEFKKAIEMNPNYGGAYYNLGYLYGELDNHYQSIQYYDKAVQFNLDLEVTLVNRALQKIKINKISSACSDLRQAYELGRKDIKPLLDKYCN